MTPEWPEGLGRFFDLTEYIIVKVFVILSLLSAVTILLYRNIAELRRLGLLKRAKSKVAEKPLEPLNQTTAIDASTAPAVGGASVSKTMHNAGNS